MSAGIAVEVLTQLLADERAARERAEAVGRELLGAAQYVLDRAQVDPDLGYLIGPHMECFERLVAAEAVALGEDAAAVRERRSKDLQPEDSARDPKVVVLQERVEELERELEAVRS